MDKINISPAQKAKIDPLIKEYETRWDSYNDGVVETRDRFEPGPYTAAFNRRYPTHFEMV